LKKYIERLYQVPDRDINIEFASKRLSFIQSTGSFRKIVAKKLQGKNSFLKKPGSKSVYVRPKAGFEKIYLALQEGLIANGVSVKLNCTAKGIKRIPTDKGKKIEIEFAGEKKVYDEIISTIPISTTSNLIGKPLEKEFESKNLLTLFYRFNGDLRHNHNVLHNFTLEGSWKRITTFSKYYGKHEGDDYFAVEITVDKDVEPNISQQQQLFESHVKSLGLFAGELKLQGSLLTRNAYPVYLNDNVDEIIRAKNKLKDWGLRLAGRQGEFDYVSSSDATGNAVKLAKSIKQEYREKIEQSDDFDDKDQSKEKSRKLLLDS